MNLFQLILKQMRQRSLSTLLTCLSIFLGMTLATSVLILGRESRAVFAQTDYGFDLLIGPKASPLQLVMNTIYHVDVSPGNLPYAMYEDLVTGRPASADGTPNPYRGLAAWAVPYAVGDSYQGRRIVATTPQLFGVDDAGQPLPADRVPHFRDEGFTFAQGRAFGASRFEAVIGMEVAKSTGLNLGSEFHATHGIPGPNQIADIHAETWKVVGILDETHTANDRCLFIPLPTFYAIFEHEEGEAAISKIQSGASPSTKSPIPTAPTPAPEQKAYTLDAAGNVTPKLPQSDWEISAILVQTRSPSALLRLQFILRNLPKAQAIGVSPAAVMGEFFDTFLSKISLLMIIISALVTMLAAVSILVSIYNSVAARNREIAIMRTLGATRQRILAAVCLEAGIVGLMGGIGGLFAGHLLTAAGSWYMRRLMGTGIPWWRLGPWELAYLAGVIVISLLAGLVPALKAYRTPVAENLIAA